MIDSMSGGLYVGTLAESVNDRQYVGWSVCRNVGRVGE